MQSFSIKYNKSRNPKCCTLEVLNKCIYLWCPQKRRSVSKTNPKKEVTFHVNSASIRFEL